MQQMLGRNAYLDGLLVSFKNGGAIAASIYGDSAPSVNSQTSQYLPHGAFTGEVAKSTLRCECVKQRLRLFQIARIEAFCKPAVDRSEKLASFLPLTLIAPQEEALRYHASVVHSFSARPGNLPRPESNSSIC